MAPDARHIDQQGQTVYVNPAMCAMLELDTPADIGSETYHRFFTTDRGWPCASWCRSSSPT